MNRQTCLTTIVPRTIFRPDPSLSMPTWEWPLEMWALLTCGKPRQHDVTIFTPQGLRVSETAQYTARS